MKETYVNATLDIINLNGSDIIITSTTCEWEGYQPDCEVETPFD